MEVLEFKTKRDKVRKVSKLLRSVGKKIGAVTFTKKDGTLRKMCYRLGIQKAKYAKMPEGIKARTRSENQMLVFDTNTVRYSSKDRMNGRGDWRTISLDTVKRMKVNGTIYKIIG